MRAIRKKIVTDEEHNPVAVLIDYDDWLEIEQLLALDYEVKGPFDPNQFAGTFDIGEDPVEYQRRIRDEWP
jgi:hypothetical protein